MTDDSLISGRKRIAHAAGKSERTITRWVRKGVLPATKDGPFRNNLLRVRAADLEKLKSMPQQAADR